MIFEKERLLISRKKETTYKPPPHIPLSPGNFAEFSKTSILNNICERIRKWNEVMKKIHTNIFTRKRQ